MSTHVESENEASRLTKWYGAACCAEIARQADELYVRVVGITPSDSLPTPGHAGVRLMDRLMPGGKRRVGVDAWPAPALDPKTVRDIAWTDRAAADAPGRYLHGYDKSGCYVAACSSVELGLGQLEHRAGPLAFDKTLPGYWLASTAAAARRWVATPQLAHMVGTAGAPAVTIHEAYVWRHHTRALEPWYRRLRDARRALLERGAAAGGRDPVAEAALHALKETYKQGIGLLGSRRFGARYPASPDFRPDWRHMVMAQAAAAIYANRAALDRAPVAIHTDCLFFLSDVSDPVAAAPQGLRLGTGLGAYKVDYAAVPVTDEMRAALAAGKAGQLESLVQRALNRERGGSEDGGSTLV